MQAILAEQKRQETELREKLKKNAEDRQKTRNMSNEDYFKTFYPKEWAEQQEKKRLAELEQLMELSIMNQTVGPITGTFVATNDLNEPNQKSESDSSSTVSDLSSSSDSSSSSSDFDGVGSKLPITTNNIMEDIELKSLEKLQDERISFEKREEIRKKEDSEERLRQFGKEFSSCASNKLTHIKNKKNLIVIKHSDINCCLKDNEYPLAMEKLKEKYGNNVKCVLHKKLPFIGVRYKIELFIPKKE